MFGRARRHNHRCGSVWAGSSYTAFLAPVKINGSPVPGAVEDITHSAQSDALVYRANDGTYSRACSNIASTFSNGTSGWMLWQFEKT